MDEEIKAEWLAALRSGEYIQGQNQLHKNIGGTDFYCCLGVLCELMAARGMVRRTKSDHEGIARWESHYYVEGQEWHKVWAYPSGDMYEMVGIDPKSPYIAINNSSGTSVAAMNDRGASFEEIADVIEEHF